MPHHFTPGALCVLLLGVVSNSLVEAQDVYRLPGPLGPKTLVPVPMQQPQDEPPPIKPPPVTSVQNENMRKLTDKLGERDAWDLQDVSIAQLAAELGKRLPCRVDTQSLECIGVTADESIGSFRADNASMYDVLHHLLKPHRVAWMIQDGALVLAAVDTTEEHLRVVVLPVADVIANLRMGEGGYDYDSMIQLILSTVEPSSWDVGMPISVIDGSLILRQSWEYARSVELLVETLRRIKQKETDSQRVALPWYSFHFDADATPAFQERITIDMESVSLSELVAQLDSLTKMPIRLDDDLPDDPKWRDCRVNFHAVDEPLCQLLRRALRRHELDVAYEHPFLVVATDELAKLRTFTRVYPVQDYLQPDEMRPPFDLFDTGGVGAYGDLDMLVEVITSEIRFDSWDEVGGSGSIEPYYTPACLVIEQTLEIHEQIEDLLKRLRRARSYALAPLKRPTLPHVAIYELAEDVPAEQTIQLLCQMVPDAKDDRNAVQPTYLRSFGQGVIVFQPPKVHQQIRRVLWLLDLSEESKQKWMGGMGMGGMGGTGMGSFGEGDEP